MKRLWIVLVSLVAGGCVVGYPEYRSAEPVATPVTLDAVVRLGKAGVSDEIIIEKVRADGITSRPTSDQVISLKSGGLSDRVIDAVISARVPTPEEVTPSPRVIYRDYFTPDPWWYYGPWWCGWGWWHPHGYYGWRGGWRH